MPTIAPRITDTRPFFRPVGRELVLLLRTLRSDDWGRPTVAGSWVVRDVLAHLVDTTMRRLSFHRDRHAPPVPDHPAAAERDLAGFINDLNRDWVTVARRFSPRVLTEVYALISGDLAEFMESLPLDAPALFPVSWAGEQASAGWFDVGREFTEQWHHQMQIRDAVGAPPLAEPRWLHAVLAIAVRGLPHAYRQTTAPDGAAIQVDVTGPGGGVWTLVRRDESWTLYDGAPDAASTTVTMTGDTAWRLLFNALRPHEAASRVTTTGEASLAAPLLAARSVVV